MNGPGTESFRLRGNAGEFPSKWETGPCAR
jgi:hypothetical protein